MQGMISRDISADMGEMVLIEGGRFHMGSDRYYPEEAPVRAVEVGSFLIDVHPVTNRQFAEFVHATKYVTVAEQAPDPADFPGALKHKLNPGALVFKPSPRPIPTDDWHQWWTYKAGAQWRRPEAKTSVIAGRLDHPVTCIAFEDAAALAARAGKALPSEAQWEYAARGGLDSKDFAWGDSFMPEGKPIANTWPGADFPCGRNSARRPFRTSRIGSFPANGYGLFDMIGNVWEGRTDWYTPTPGAHSPCCGGVPADSYVPCQPEIRIPRRVVKGGSFLCAPNYCVRYRPAARHPQMVDTGTVHIGFRCVAAAPG